MLIFLLQSREIRNGGDSTRCKYFTVTKELKIVAQERKGAQKRNKCSVIAGSP